MNIYFKVSQFEQAGRLKKLAAYNVGQCLSSDSDIEHLNLPQP